MNMPLESLSIPDGPQRPEKDFDGNEAAEAGERSVTDSIAEFIEQFLEARPGIVGDWGDDTLKGRELMVGRPLLTAIKNIFRSHGIDISDNVKLEGKGHRGGVTLRIIGDDNKQVLTFRVNWDNRLDREFMVLSTTNARSLIREQKRRNEQLDRSNEEPSLNEIERKINGT